MIDVPEPELVRFIAFSLRRLYDAFGFVFDDFSAAERKGWTYLFLAEIPRARLNLDPRLQPGDIDVLIIPSINGRRMLEHAAAIEVKRLPLRTGFLGKNVGRYGVTQALGLLRDGFPLAGVLHIIVTEPGPPEHIRDLQQWRVTDDQGHIEFVKDVRADITGSLAADRQIERLGFNAIALQRVKTSENGFVVYPSYGRRASRNPNVSPQLLKAIAALADEFGDDTPTRD